jgi:hypothetical protein
VVVPNVALFRLDRLLVIEQPVCCSHPGLPEVVHLLGQNPGPQRRLMVTSADHRNAQAFRAENIDQNSPILRRKVIKHSLPDADRRAIAWNVVDGDHQRILACRQLGQLEIDLVEPDERGCEAKIDDLCL